jgi:1,2-diacylglycerol 3-beta-glucosyltransferase
VRRALLTAGWMAGGWAAACTGYLLALLAAAAGRGSRHGVPPLGPDLEPQLLVLVPAHDESGVIAACVGSLVAADYPPDRRAIVVVADNCADDTAERARAAGALVWERDDAARPGKGPALAWALDHARRAVPDFAGVVMVDADCRASAGLLSALAARLSTGQAIVQADYTIANPEASTAAALRYAGFALVNTVRPRGKTALGLSCGLLGTGMALSRDVLEAVPWRAFSVTEDREYHLRAVWAGWRATFAAEAAVTSPAPTTHQAAQTQQMRWETGNVELARRWVPRLAGRGLRRRDVQELHLALELLVPPLSLVVAAGGLAAAAGAALRSRRLTLTGATALAGVTAYVLGGLRLVGAPRTVFSALARAPRLIAMRLAQYSRLGVGRGVTGWQRTAREGAPE